MGGAYVTTTETRVHVPHTVETGELLLEQTDALRPFVIGRRVYDLGAGDMKLTAKLRLECRAGHVVAVDKAYQQKHTYGPVTILGAWFHELKEPLEVAFVSWPPYMMLFPPAPHYVKGLIDVCASASVVAYLGSNFGSACGNPELWLSWGTREVLAHVPNRRNTLIVYGRHGGRHPGQGQLPEESAAIYRHVVPLPEYGVTYG